MDIRPIHNDDDLAWALHEVEPYFVSQPQPGSPDGDRFDILSTLIERYEAEHHAVGLPDPIEAVVERMADKGLSRRQLCAATGIAESKLSEVLNRRRGLSLSMIRALGRELGLPAEVLVQEYPLAMEMA